MKDNFKANTTGMKYSSGYAYIRDQFENDRCVILDGAIATELQRVGAGEIKLSDDTHWGFDALHISPESVLNVHQRYLQAGAEVLTTNTYSILSAPSYTADYDIHVAQPIHWMDLTRQAIELPRKAIATANRESTAAIAFSIGGEIETRDQQVTVDLLLKIFEDTPPDLILFETLSLIEDNLTFETIETLIERGWPVWVSFRRCRKGICGIHGQLWGGPEGDRFGRLARSLEQRGVEALMINCLPTSRVAGTLSWLRDFTSLPLGVYPNTGRYAESGWRFDSEMEGEEFAKLALGWRAEGAQLIGGCCGVGPVEIKQVAKKLNAIPRGKTKKAPSKLSGFNQNADFAKVKNWTDQQDRELFPLPFPEITVDPGVFVPTQGSYLIWKYLFNSRIGESKFCLDIGCGVGLLAIQLALNGATNVTAVDIQLEAIKNTRTNAFRNGVADRVTGVVTDLYSFIPDDKFDVIVASLYQMPTNPRGQFSGHRDIDYWGRNLLDHCIKNLNHYLAKGGTAYLMQVSMLGAKRTESLLEKHGFQYNIVDFNLYPFNAVFKDNIEQIQAVENLSDAYHFNFGADQHTMVMYLLEIRHG